VDDPLDGPPLTVCTSCGALNSQRDRCACVVTRARALALLGHELRRMTIPGWRRPRPWPDLPDGVRHGLVSVALGIVETLEGHGWRMVSTQRPGSAHELEEDPYAEAPGSVAYFVTQPDAPVHTSALVRPYVDPPTDPDGTWAGTMRGAPDAVQ
jgi:hypothetical protein